MKPIGYATLVRWMLTLFILVDGIYPETGLWTCLAIGLLTANSEYTYGRQMGWWS